MAYRHKRSKPSFYGKPRGGVRIARPSFLSKFDFTRDKQAMLSSKISRIGRKVDLVSETKYVDGQYSGTIQDLSGTDATWAGTESNPSQDTTAYGCMPIPRVGDLYSDRDGRKIYVKDIRIKGIIRWNPERVTTATGNFASYTGGPVRLILVKDKRTNGATLNGEDVIGAGQGSDGAVVSSNQSAISLPTKPDGWGRYEIMKDKTYTYKAGPPTIAVGVGDGSNSDEQVVNGYEIPFKMHVKANCYVNFKADPGAIASVVDNSFTLLAAESSSGDCTLEYYVRTSFVG